MWIDRDLNSECAVQIGDFGRKWAKITAFRARVDRLSLRGSTVGLRRPTLLILPSLVAMFPRSQYFINWSTPACQLPGCTVKQERVLHGLNQKRARDVVKSSINLWSWSTSAYKGRQTLCLQPRGTQ
ncbi:hypothetical protein B0H13DRAFT_1855969 [Mycena leptocephala]|nr:hypothetical protein B0H13DRAFT_1855969 [Mycena leptocephala]